MRKVLLATVATAIVMSVPMASIVKAEDTTVIKKDNDADRTKTVIKKDEPSEKKVIIKKDHDD
jgi:hypothetical protein